MLRLLPDRLYAGLLGSHAWLAHGISGQLLPPPPIVSASNSPAELLGAMLEAVPARRRGRKLSIILPSRLAQCMSLPWSNNLRGCEENQAYARAYLEQAGLNAGDSHVVHAEFRHYGAQGLTYAVSKQLLDELYSVAARHSLALTTVLPINGLAYLAAARARGSRFELSFIVEDTSVSVLAMDRAGLQRYDAELAVGSQRAALRRLLTRLLADDIELEGVSICSAGSNVELAELASGFIDQVPVRTVQPWQWRRFL